MAWFHIVFFAPAAWVNAWQIQVSRYRGETFVLGRMYALPTVDRAEAQQQALHLILNSPDPFFAELRRWWWAGAKRPEGV